MHAEPPITPPSRHYQPDGRVHGVVIACRRADGRYLCIRRSQHVAAPLKVCFPGGGIDADEDCATAAIREMQEELGVTVRPLRQVWRWDSPDKPLTLFGWIAEMDDGQTIHPDPHEVAEVLWLTGLEVADHADCMPTNRLFVESLEADVPILDNPA